MMTRQGCSSYHNDVRLIINDSRLASPLQNDKITYSRSALHFIMLICSSSWISQKRLNPHRIKTAKSRIYGAVYYLSALNWPQLKSECTWTAFELCSIASNRSYIEERWGLDIYYYVRLDTKFAYQCFSLLLLLLLLLVGFCTYYYLLIDST